MYQKKAFNRREQDYAMGLRRKLEEAEAMLQHLAPSRREKPGTDQAGRSTALGERGHCGSRAPAGLYGCTAEQEL